MCPLRVMVVVCAIAGVAAADERVDFRADVLPLLKQSCYRCHGPKKQSGGFRFDRRTSVRAKASRLRPGSSATSKVYLRVAGEDFGPQMPLDGELDARQIDLIKAWIDQGADWPDALAGKDRPPRLPDAAATRMIEAIRRGDRAALAEELAKTPRAASRFGDGDATPLMAAALLGDAESTKLLLDRRADPNLANAAGSTALMWGAADERVTRLLLDRGARPYAVSVYGFGALAVAAGRVGNVRTVELLLARGAKPSKDGVDLVMAANAGDATIFRTLIEHGADPKAAGSWGLAMGARSRCAPCVDAIIGALKPAELSDALVALAPFGDAALVGRLLDRGADVNARVMETRRDMRGRMPLLMAASSDIVPVEAVKLLLARGADVNATGPEGETALDLARRNGATAVVELLTRAGAKPGRADAPPAASPKPSASPRAAVARALPVLQRGDVGFIEKTGCVSCHNNSLTAMALAASRASRVPFDDSTFQAQVRVTAEILANQYNESLVGDEVQEAVSNILVGLAAGGHAGSLATDAVTVFLEARQLADGHWRSYFIDHRPPIQGSEFDATAAAIRALVVYAPAPRKAQVARAVERAAAWLLAAEPHTGAERAAQLLGLSWAGVDPGHERLRAAARALLAEQRADGGWGQLTTLDSDAFATGQSLVALAECGALRPSDPAYQRGVRFLLDRQLEDGTWHVRSRVIPFQPYFESGFPHGHDQWVSMAATNWAVMALARAAAGE